VAQLRPVGLSRAKEFASRLLLTAPVRLAIRPSLRSVDPVSSPGLPRSFVLLIVDLGVGDRFTRRIRKFYYYPLLIFSLFCCT
jgi:hypothetical protein